MADRLSPAARGDIAHGIADRLEALAAKRHANPRFAHYAQQFRGLGDRIDAALGRTGAWRKARKASAATIDRIDELMDYLLTRLHNDLEAEATLVLNEPERARLADQLLASLFPLHTLAELIGLRDDREVNEVGKLLQTAAASEVAAELKTLGCDGYIARLSKLLPEAREALGERDQKARSGSAETTATAVAAEFPALWKKFDGFLTDAFDDDDAAQAATATSLRAPYREALARLDAIARAASTREARRAATKESPAATTPPPTP